MLCCLFQKKFKKKIMNILKFKKCIIYRNKKNLISQFKISILKNKRLTLLTHFLTNISKENIQTYENRHRRVCLVTGRFRSIHNTLYFKRHILKSSLTLNNVPGIKKLSW